MREEDTVMNFADIEKAYLSGYNHNKDTILPDTARHWGGELSIAKAQAQISFKAGYEKAVGECLGDKAYDQIKQEGRREVVEWVNSNAGLGAKTIEELNEGYSFIPIRSDKWQAYLKEKGL